MLSNYFMVAIPFFRCKIIFVCRTCTNFLTRKFCIRSNYSSRAVIHVNHTKIFLHENFYHEIFLHENKTNYGSSCSAHEDLKCLNLDVKLYSKNQFG